MEMTPGPLRRAWITSGTGSEKMLSAAGLASAKEAVSMFWAVMDLSRAEGSGHNAGLSFTVEADNTC